MDSSTKGQIELDKVGDAKRVRVTIDIEKPWPHGRILAAEPKQPSPR